MTTDASSSSLTPAPVGAGALLSPLDLANEADLIKVLESSLYPGAKPESIKLVISYCRFNGHDPLKKPVHIVPMSVKMKVPNPSYREGTNSPKTVEQYVERDVLMPGIGLYRTDAARTEQYMGMTEPVYGPTVDGIFGNITVKYPEWCSITVKRLVAGRVVDFPAKEYWLENYATAGRDSIVPNAMWKKRPFGQLGKCTEAQALRKAFPETVGSAPTAEEMAGKTINEDEIGPDHMIVDKTRERSEALRRELTEGDAGKTIDVKPEKSSQPAASSPAATTKPAATSKEPPPGVPASVGETVTEPPAKKAAPAPAAKQETAAVTEEAKPEPVVEPAEDAGPPGIREPLTIAGTAYPVELRAKSIGDRVKLDQYTLLSDEAARLGKKLDDLTQSDLGCKANDLSKDAAKLYLEHLKSLQPAD